MRRHGWSGDIPADDEDAKNRILDATRFTAGVTSDTAIAFGRSLLKRSQIDWPATGFTEDKLDELVEVMLRMLQSLIIDPGRPARDGQALRNFLATWIAPAICERADQRARPQGNHHESDRNV